MRDDVAVKEKQGILIVERNKDVTEEEDRPTKHIFKDCACSQDTKRQQANITSNNSPSN
jgi:hypothetical protein